MLKELFESSFYKTYKRNHDELLFLHEAFYNDTFGLKDDKACKDCKAQSSCVSQLNINSESTAAVISIDEVFSYLSDDHVESCDYMLENKETIALIEMGCTESTYYESKRVKARKQLFNTLFFLDGCPNVNHHLDLKGKKYVIFSWKQKDSRSLSDSIASSMKAMTLLPDKIYSPLNESNFDFDFRWKEIHFPDIFMC